MSHPTAAAPGFGAFRRRVPEGGRGPLVLGLLLVLAGLLRAQPAPRRADPGFPPTKVYALEEGLPQNTVLHLGRDPQGRLWVGTQDGAARYDGNQWRTYSMPEATRSNTVECILHDREGAIWFGRRNGGVALLKGGGWQIFEVAQGLPKGRVTSLLETRDGEGRTWIWASVLGAGLARFDGRRWEIPPETRSLPSSRIWKLVLLPGREDAFWVATENGLARWEGGRISEAPGVPRDNFNCLIDGRGPRGEGPLWLGTYGNGLLRVEGGRVERFTVADGLPSPFVTDLAVVPDPKGGPTLWAATLNGLGRFRNGRWSAFGANNGLPASTLYRVLATGERGGQEYLWLGTSGSGLIRLALDRWTSHDRRTGLPEGRAWCVLETRTGNLEGILWVGTPAGLLRYQGGRWEPQPPEDRILALAEGRDDRGRPRLWVGGVKGLWCFASGGWHQVGPGEGFTGTRVNALYPTQDEDGSPVLWVGTELNGLFRLHRGHWSTFLPSAGLPGDFITTLQEVRDVQGRRALWIGTRTGLACLDDRGLRPIRPAGDLPNESVTSLLPFPATGPTTHLLVGTFGGGIFRVDLARPEDPPTPFLEAEGPDLPSGTVQDLMWDHRGRLYVFTIKGVLRLSPTVGGKWLPLLFTREDGLPSEQVTAKGASLGSGNRIWVATTGGAACLEPDSVRPDHVPKPLLLNEFLVDGHPVPSGPQPSLPWTTRRITFRYSLLSLFREKETLFRTQLLDLENEPGTWEKEAFREFSALPAGVYRLRVWAKDYAGNLSGPLDLRFQLLPAPWQTGWFRGLALLAGALAVWGIIRWRLHQVQARSNELETLVAQRTQDLARANLVLQQEAQVRRVAERTKDEFVAVVSHELRTPLTSIHGALGILRAGAMGSLSREMGRLVELAHRNSLRLQALVNDLLDIQKIEAGNLTLSPGFLDLRSVVARAVEAMASYADTCKVQIRVEEEARACLIHGDAGRLEQVLMNLISNACKHSREGGVVLVEVRSGGERTLVAVTNHGDPIPEEFRPYIFQKFAMADASTTRRVGGTGLGLAICKAIIDKHGGRIDYDSGGGGTRFWFELPSTEVPEPIPIP